MTAATTSVATLPVVRALLDEAVRKNYSAGALGIRARPEWGGPTSFEHQGVPVTVVPCVSSLAVREALRSRGGDRWVVIVTDRDDADLGAGIRSHLIWHRLRTPDPWAAVRVRFAAEGLDPALTLAADHRELASGLLAATPVPGGWPPAPGGVLTRDHALGSVARAHLHLPVGELAATAALTWTAQPPTVGLIGDLRGLAGDGLTDAVLDWVAQRVGAAAPLLSQLLRRGQSREIVPLGLVLEALLRSQQAGGAEDLVLAREALVRLEPRTGGASAPRGALASWAEEAGVVVRPLINHRELRPLGEQLLAAADVVLADVRASALAEQSDLLPSGLTARLTRLASGLLAAVRSEAGQEIDQPLVQRSSLDAVEPAWDAVNRHHLADGDRRVDAFRAAVRLTRWLAVDSRGEGHDLAALHRRHLDADAWVDTAVNDAAPGVGDPELGEALAAVLELVRRRRDRHDGDFARALAEFTRDDRPGTPSAVRLEELLPSVILPIARRAPVLLLVLDGMSAAVGNEVVESITAKLSDGWVEHVPDGRPRRIGAVSVLPSLTEVSRTSLLCGQLLTGQQDAERRGYAELVRAYGLAGASLFHKKPLDSSRPGFSVADDVGAAIDDQAGQPLVTCILNTIDDALDRSDPVGTVWTADAVKNLSPLLERARLAGRVVVLTSDHGHIVERRQGRQQSAADISSGRSRADGPAGEGEIRIAGRRVLKHDGRAVLAVDERLRYGPLKAGYHGGAAPAEVVIPVYFLVSGAPSGESGLTPATPQEPAWWSDRVRSTAPASPAPDPVSVPARRSAAARPAAAGAMTLFDEVVDEPSAPPAAPSPAVHPLGASTIASTTYREQRTLAGRVTVTDEQVRQLLEVLLERTDRRLPRTAAAVALGVAPVALRGAVLHVQRLLNVEGYAVVSFDVDGSTVVLDEALLREQFELGS
ncbi:BREX-2 system phosphatase PglZ [Modestobacter sp. VKM Ac-2985]|uniref:BREX-2 system phosphatase PglZ n=1 Tax=Modestobacter sp. VKM Ac-2985 TaxID=3004139 RepID=UPI0022ABB4B2|nr:BREX-2 system phosphatase PglZ [Modestobacter sp. VKM Ac-2985]MCZ2839922.1 BREX-2 system phosphatase PglZ [Modestobacter sp. VKM Ac-2985]